MRTVLFIAAMAMGITATAQNNIAYIRSTDLPGNSITYTYPDDYIEDVTNAKVVGLIQATAPSSGTVLVKSDLNNGATVSANMYSGTPTNWWNSIRILPINGHHYMLGTYMNNVQTLALSKVNGVTGAIMFTKYLASSITGNSPELTVADMCYDGSAYIYVTGNEYNTSSSQNEAWAAKFDLNGVLQWKRTYVNTGQDEYPKNIFYHISGTIYIGGICNPVSSPLHLSGLLMQIDASGGVVQSKELRWWPSFPSPVGERIVMLNLKRDVENLYVVAQSLKGPNAADHTLVAQLDLNMNPVSYTIYDDQEGCFLFNQEFYFTNNKIMVPGAKNYVDALTPGYLTAFFNLNSTHIGTTHLQVNSDLFGTIVSYPSATGYIFSLAQNGVNNDHFYRIKGYPNTGAVDDGCNDPYNLFPYDETLLINSHPLTMAINKALTMNNFTSYVSALTPHDSIVCYHDPSMQRLAGETGGDAVNIYPNPFTDQLHLGIPDGHSVTHLRIIDLAGRVVYEAENPGATIMPADLVSGVYLLEAQISDGSTITEKIIRQ
jgi:hypothetical protein